MYHTTRFGVTADVIPPQVGVSSLFGLRHQVVIKNAVLAEPEKNLMKMDHTRSLETPNVIITPAESRDMLYKMCDMYTAHTHTHTLCGANTHIKHDKPSLRSFFSVCFFVLVVFLVSRGLMPEFFLKNTARSDDALTLLARFNTQKAGMGIQGVYDHTHTHS